MKKILHIPNYYPPHIGGIEEVCYSIVKSLPSYEHKVLCFNDGKTTCRDYDEGVEIIRCGIYTKLFSQALSFTYFTEMRKLFKSFQPDIVHFHTPNPLISVYLMLLIPPSTTLIIHWHSDIVAQDLLYIFYRSIEKKMLCRADKILITSPTYILGSKPLQPFKEKICVVPNTVNITKLKPGADDSEGIEQVKKQYGGKKIVFTFGRHVPYKGLEYLLEAVPYFHDNTAVVVAGTGPLTAKLKTMPNAAAVHFPGKLSDTELRQYLYASDVFAFPSITRNEAFGIALAEAMYCGLPAVTFTIPCSGVNWVCPNGETGIEVPNKDSKSYAEAVNKLLEDSTLRESLGANASKRVLTNFTVDSIVNDLTDIYETTFHHIG